ncbi:MAG TPA: hypothetical protein VH678_06800 [Xanthobacteraceae bacterium]
MTTKPDITAADIAKELKVSPREARMKLRAAGIRAPYKPSDVAKMRAVIHGDKVSNVKPKADTKPTKPKKGEATTH